MPLRATHSRQQVLDQPEELEALAFLDPNRTGRLALDTFLRWYMGGGGDGANTQ
jgi:hypothetical protein